MENPAQPQRYRLGVDIGGTFTDLVILNEDSGRIQTLKVSSTPHDPSQAALNGVRRVRDELGIDLARVAQFTHASTVASNTVLQARGARTALLTTEGFRDLLEIQRHKRYRLFDQSYQKIPPLVPRRLSFGVPERVDETGVVITPLDEAALRNVLKTLAAGKIEALAICFLFSFRNAAHEQRAGAIAREMLPGCFVTLSSDIYPQYREYERASTTVVNAYLGPQVSTYLERMNAALSREGITVPLHMMQSNGGIMAWTEATAMPCRIVESGPAAGVIAAAHFGKLAGRTNLLSFDMGGTTAKAGLIENGEVRQSSGQELGAGINISRILHGGGYYVGAATVDLAEVGAGGGSIAWLDQRRAQGWAAKRRRRSRADRLWTGRRARHGDRRKSAARAHSIGVFPRRRDETRHGESARDRRTRIGGTAQHHGRRGLRGGDRGGECEHAQDAAHRHRRERLRSGRLYAGGVRRQRPGARHRTRR